MDCVLFILFRILSSAKLLPLLPFLGGEHTTVDKLVRGCSSAFEMTAATTERDTEL